jgi:hypothetical protein
MDKDPVAVTNAALDQPRSRGPDPVGQVGPGPDAVATDEAGAVREAGAGLQEERRKVRGWDQRSGSRMLT